MACCIKPKSPVSNAERTEILGILERCGVSGEQIAIELTESRSERDFMLMKEKIEELKGKGLTFYLDDFGTGAERMKEEQSAYARINALGTG